MAQDWSIEEVRLAVEDYFAMLQLELDYLPYNKAAHNAELLKKLNNRSKGSVEFKHQNITAVLESLGQPYIRGYKRRSNYQHLLEEEVIRYVAAHRDSLERRFSKFADERIELSDKQLDFSKILADEPVESKLVKREPSFRPIKVNYLEREQNNSSLGRSGEMLVIEFEKWRLIREGKGNLADRVEWTSQIKGDGTGFDILSKNINGTDRYIEVKTTKLRKETPIYLTKNEVAFANKHSNHFFLYRVFDFADTPKIFMKQGNYDNYCTLLPQTFTGFFKH